MAKLFLSGIDAAAIPLLRLRVENLATAPTGAAVLAGYTYFDTTVGAQLHYDGTAWRNPRARSDHTGQQVAATISDFTATVRTSRLDQMAAPGANIVMGGFTLTGLPAPSGAGQPAESNWVTQQIQSAAAGIASKPPVNAVATTNITLSGLAAVDGYTPVATDRILVVGQTTGTQNGVYNPAAAAWTRTTVDGSAPGEIEPGAMWLVVSGTVNAGTQWRVSTTGVITVGTTALSIVQFGAGQSYTAGNGLSLVGSAFSVLPLAGGGILSTASGVSVDPTVFTRKFAATIGDGSSLSITVTHNLNSMDLVPAARVVANNAPVDIDFTPVTVNTGTFSFNTAPAANAYRVVLVG